MAGGVIQLGFQTVERMYLIIFHGAGKLTEPDARAGRLTQMKEAFTTAEKDLYLLSACVILRYQRSEMPTLTFMGSAASR